MSVVNQTPQPEITLVLQGGGALGAYQVGAYKAMRDYGQEPTVLSGISIGAVNAAIIAGNKPEHRMAKLEQFWRMVSWPSPTDHAPAMMSGGYFGAMHHAIGIWQAFMLGQPNFFKPRWTNPWLASPGTAEATSFEDTSMLRTTLEQLIDFNLINGSERKVRLFIGAVKVTTGEMVFFDSFKEAITVDHVMASGALPPGFPGVRINGDLYWDGGCCSNTVIDVTVEQNPHVDKRIFMPTLFNPVGPEPKTMDEVFVRQQDIQYASRSVQHVRQILERHELRRKLRQERRAKQEAQLAAQKESGLAGLGLNTAVKPLINIRRPDERLTRLEIVHVMYRSPQFEGVRRDTDFARPSIERRSDAGYADMHLAIKDSAWLVA